VKLVWLDGSKQDLKLETKNRVLKHRQQ